MAPYPKILAATIAGVLSLSCSGVTAPDGLRCGASDGDPSAGAPAGHVEVSLVPGSTCAVRAESGRSLRLPPSAGSAEYLLAVQSASEVPASRASLSLSVSVAQRGSTETDGVGASRAGRPVARRPAAHAEPSETSPTRSFDRESMFRREALGAISRAGGRPLRPASPGPDESVRLSRGASVPGIGDTLVIRISVDPFLRVDCRRTETARAVVRAVGERFLILEDLDVWGSPGPADYRRVLTALDRVVHPTSTAYFGETADLDRNGRVIAFFTPVVNRTTPRGSGTFVAGFFSPTDLSDPATCPASNGGEILYLRASDPYAAFGDPVGVTAATSGAVGVAAHELTHLIEAQRRIVDGGGTFANLEEPWLAEALAHASETIVGMAAAGHVPRSNYGFTALASDPAIFDTYHKPNLTRASLYLANPARTMALGGAEGSDPGGIRSLEMRGFGWLFLRWLADHASVGGGGHLGGPAEERLFRDLIGGGPSLARGIANVERVAAGLLGTRDWSTLLSRYALAPLADDTNGAPSDDAHVPSFDLPDAFGGLRSAAPARNPSAATYPLVSTSIDVGGIRNESFDFELSASAAEYFVLSSAGPHGAIDVTLTTPTGAAVPGTSRPQIVVQRTR